jgi:hypothetical protein
MAIEVRLDKSLLHEIVAVDARLEPGVEIPRTDYLLQEGEIGIPAAVLIVAVH